MLTRTFELQESKYTEQLSALELERAIQFVFQEGKTEDIFRLMRWVTLFDSWHVPIYPGEGITAVHQLWHGARSYFGPQEEDKIEPLVQQPLVDGSYFAWYPQSRKFHKTFSVFTHPPKGIPTTQVKGARLVELLETSASDIKYFALNPVVEDHQFSGGIPAQEMRTSLLVQWPKILQTELAILGASSPRGQGEYVYDSKFISDFKKRETPIWALLDSKSQSIADSEDGKSIICFIAPDVALRFQETLQPSSVFSIHENGQVGKIANSLQDFQTLLENAGLDTTKQTEFMIPSQYRPGGNFCEAHISFLV